MMWKLTLTDPGTNFGIRYDPWLYRGGFLWVSIATLMIIAAVTHLASRLGRFLGNPLLNWIGTRSYGLYIFHWPIYQIIRKYAGVVLDWQQFVLAMAITVPITELSYRFVETPIRKGRLGEWWRGRHDLRRRQPAHPLDSRRPIYALSAVVLALVGFSVFSIARADNHCVGDVECTLQQADAPTTVAAPVDAGRRRRRPPACRSPTPAATWSPRRPRWPPSTTTTTPPPPPAMAAFGESVMLGAKSQLDAGGFAVDAAESRQAKDMVAEIQHAAAAGQLGPVVVVQVGTNGTVTAAELDAMVAAMPADTRLYFLTVKANLPWIDSNNDKIRNLPARAPERGRDRLADRRRPDRRPAQRLRRRRPPAHQEGAAVLRQHDLRRRRPQRSGPADRFVARRARPNPRRVVEGQLEGDVRSGRGVAILANRAGLAAAARPAGADQSTALHARARRPSRARRDRRDGVPRQPRLAAAAGSSASRCSS